MANQRTLPTKSLFILLISLVVLAVAAGLVYQRLSPTPAPRVPSTRPSSPTTTVSDATAPTTQPSPHTSEATDAPSSQPAAPIATTHDAPSPLGRSDWIGFHGGGPLLGVAGAIAAPPMKVRWKFRIGDDDLPLPVVATTRPTTGSSTQASTTPSSSSSSFAAGNFESAVAVVNGVVYAADTAGVLLAIDLKTGKAKWIFQAEDGFDTTPLILNGRLFIGDLGGMFYGLAADTGKKIWSFDSGGAEIHCSANYLGLDRERIVFGNDASDVFCLSADTGKVIWNKKSGAQIYGTPSVSNGSALVSGCDAQLRAFRGTDGTEEFTVDLGAPCAGSTAVAGDHLVLGTDQGRVLCISAKSHDVTWTFDKVGDEAWVYSSPAIAEGVVVFGARDRKVYGLDLVSGKLLWTFATRGEVDSSPVISGGRVYFGSKDKKFYVLDLKSGKQLWVFTAGRGIVASPAIAAGVVVIGDTGGNLFCLE